VLVSSVTSLEKIGKQGSGLAPILFTLWS